MQRYSALDFYRNAYFQEIRRRLMRKENLKDDEIIPRAASIFSPGNEGLMAVEQALAPQKKKEFAKSIAILKTIVERL